MAYAEQRGKTWRARYLTPDGTYASEPGFKTKAAAKRHGEDQEAAIRQKTWIDPDRATISLEEWWTQWIPAQDIAERTVDDYAGAWRNHLQQRFGHLPLRDISGLDVDAWYKELLGRRSTRTANGARKLLKLMLEDAVVDRRILVCPIRPLSRRRGQSIANQSPPRPGMVVQLEAVLRICARLSKQDALMVITGYFTGMRFGELIGIRKSFLFLVPAADGAPASGYYIIDKKIGSVHEDKRGQRSFGPPKGYKGRTIELPPFLVELLLAYIGAMPRDRDLLFTNRAGVWWARSNWSEQWRAACDGWGAKEAKRGRAAKEAAAPIVLGMHTHDLRHTHKTQLAEDGIEKAARDERLGHVAEGMDGVYIHSTPVMRARLLESLQVRWEREFSAQKS
jgi:integrase